MTFHTTTAWEEDQRRLIAQDWDNINLVTGREGTGKSAWMRRCAKRLDPAFSVEHIHFEAEDFHADVHRLSPGRAVVLDEFRGHRRLAMHKERTDFLDFVKECRGLRLHIFIGFPRITNFERDLVTDRISYWSHLRTRGLVEIRKPTTELMFDYNGEPLEKTRYPMVAHFRFKDQPDPAYSAKKAARMKERAAGFLNTKEEKQEGVVPKFNEEAFRAAVLAQALKPMSHPKMIDEVQRELKR